MSDARAVLGTRFLAAVIDLVPFVVVGLVLRVAGSDEVAVVVTAALNIAYFARLESRPEGQTLGKRLLGLHVADAATGAPLLMQQAVVRAAMRYVSGVACLVGFVWAFVDKQGRTWHDVVAGTVVAPSGDQAA